MEPIQTATKGVEVAGKTAGLIADYGMLIVVGSVVVLGLLAALYLTFSYWKRKITGDYIPVKDIEAYIKKNNPSILKLSADELPKLTEHALFTNCTAGIRSAETLEIMDADVTDQVKTDLARDLLIWSFRAHRNIFSGLVAAAYEHKNGFEGALGDKQKLRAIVTEHLSIVSGAVKSKLVGELDFPTKVYDAWCNSQKEKDKIFLDVIEITISQNIDTYSQFNNILTAIYSKVMPLETEVIKFIKNYNTEGISYAPGDTAREGTYSGMRKAGFSSYNPNHSATLETGWKSKL